MSIFMYNPKNIADKTKFLQEMVEIVADAKTPYIAKVLKDELCAKMDLDPSIFTERPKFIKPAVKQENEAVVENKLRISKEAVLALVMYAQNVDLQESMVFEQFLPFLMDKTLMEYAKKCVLDANIGNQPTKWIDHWTNPAYKAMLTQVLVSFDDLLTSSASEKIWVDCFSKLKKQYVGVLVQQIQKLKQWDNRSKLKICQSR
ncbi:MAG: hypothetical protein R3A45_09540 [Bdellovibrionota bacterium]